MQTKNIKNLNISEIVYAWQRRFLTQPNYYYHKIELFGRIRKEYLQKLRD